MRLADDLTYIVLHKDYEIKIFVNIFFEKNIESIFVDKQNYFDYISGKRYYLKNNFDLEYHSPSEPIFTEDLGRMIYITHSDNKLLLKVEKLIKVHERKEKLKKLKQK